MSFRLGLSNARIVVHVLFPFRSTRMLTPFGFSVTKRYHILLHKIKSTVFLGSSIRSTPLTEVSDAHGPSSVEPFNENVFFPDALRPSDVFLVTGPSRRRCRVYPLPPTSLEIHCRRHPGKSYLIIILL